MSAVLGRGRTGPAGEAEDLTSFAEIARQLGVSAQSVEKSYHAAVKKLKQSPELLRQLEEIRP